jgi:hypothetical protein
LLGDRMASQSGEEIRSHTHTHSIANARQVNIETKCSHMVCNRLLGMQNQVGASHFDLVLLPSVEVNKARLQGTGSSPIPDLAMAVAIGQHRCNGGKQHSVLPIDEQRHTNRCKSFWAQKQSSQKHPHHIRHAAIDLVDDGGSHHHWGDPSRTARQSNLTKLDEAERQNQCFSSVVRCQCIPRCEFIPSDDELPGAIPIGWVAGHSLAMKLGSCTYHTHPVHRSGRPLLRHPQECEG